MSCYDYKTLEPHVRHDIRVVRYGEGNITVECVDCQEVIVSYDKDPEENGTEPVPKGEPDLLAIGTAAIDKAKKSGMVDDWNVEVYPRQLRLKIFLKRKEEEGEE